MRAVTVWAIVCCLCAAVSAQEKDAYALVTEANEAFAAEDYQAALEAYRAAEVTQPESPELAFNQGVAHFKLGDYEAAKDAFNRALLTRDLGLEAKVKFNLGNVAYASALEKMSNLQESIDLLKTGIGRYRDALELNPKDEDARTNIEMAQLLIKDLLDKLKKQQEEQEKNQDQQKDDQKQEQQEGDQEQKQQEGDQEQKQQEGDQKQEGEQKDQKQGDEQQDQSQDQKGQQQGQNENQQQEQQQQQARAGDKMTEEEADRLLQSVRDKERKRREEKARRMRARRVPVLRDW